MWSSINDLLDGIKGEEYVFLRNAQSINEEFDESEDWDILCKDAGKFISKIHAKPLNENEIENKCFNYYTIVNDKKLLIDIRQIGDGYYDELWELHMLRDRLSHMNYYVLDNVNEKYSLLYHYLIQKKTDDNSKYKSFIIQNFDEWNIEDNIKALAGFMKKNNYSFATPIDSWVYLNKKNIKLLEEKING
jgi:hypothetical protein